MTFPYRPDLVAGLAKRANPRRSEEDQLQIATADLCRMIMHPCVMYWHTPNGGQRSKATAGKLKAMGVRAGVPDWVFLWDSPIGDVPCMNTCFVELKAAKGRLSAEQEAFRDWAIDNGSRWALCRSLDEFHATLKAWGVPMKGESR